MIHVSSSNVIIYIKKGIVTMKKQAIALALAASMTATLVGCGEKDPKETTTANATQAPSGTEATKATEGGNNNTTTVADPGTKAETPEFSNGKFKETKKIRVEVYDRSPEGGTDAADNMYTDYIKKGMLEDHNVEVEFVKVPRWTEGQELNNLLSAGTAPDICVTYDYPTIQNYANRGGVLDMAPFLNDYKADCQNLWTWLGDTNINWNKDPKTGTIWAIEGKRATSNRIVTFIRKDWLDKLGLKEPTTKEEFEKCLVAFRDNASTLLGDDADKMIPYSVSYDVGWRAGTLIESFIDPNISDRDYYVNGFDDRKFTMPGTKDAIKLLNKWYNDGLMWKDFALYGADDATEDNNMKAGFVGAITHNWDYVFRNGDKSINAELKNLVGADAKFVAIDPFEDKNGTHTKFVTSTAGDRKLFFPATCKEPLACLMYLDWISDPEHIQFLQLGEEGVGHEKSADGKYYITKKIEGGNKAFMNSGSNIDLTITCNGLRLATEEATTLTTANSYAENDPALVAGADKIAKTNMRYDKNVAVGAIEAEDGQGQILGDKRNAAFQKAVVCKPDQFDSVWDENMADYMTSGGQEIHDERDEAWVKTYGDVSSLPQ